MNIFKLIRDRIFGKLVVIKVIKTDFDPEYDNPNYTLVELAELPDKQHRRVNGHIGLPGDFVTVNEYDLKGL